MTSLACIVISLDSDGPVPLITDLKSMGLEPQVLPAVDGRGGTFDRVGSFDSDTAAVRTGYQLSTSAIACALSHQDAYRWFLNTSSQWAVVLEDDALVEPDLLKIVTLALAQIPSWLPSVIQLGTRGQAFLEPRSAKSLQGSTTLFSFRYVPSQTVGYVISRSVAEIACSSVLDGPADWPTWASRVRFFGVYPWCVRETGRPSTIAIAPTNSARRTFLSVTGGLYLLNRSRYEGLSEYSLREWRPRLEAFAWRLRGRPKAFGADGPWVPVTTCRSISTVGGLRW